MYQVLGRLNDIARAGRAWKCKQSTQRRAFYSFYVLHKCEARQNVCRPGARNLLVIWFWWPWWIYKKPGIWKMCYMKTHMWCDSSSFFFVFCCWNFYVRFNIRDIIWRYFNGRADCKHEIFLFFVCLMKLLFQIEYSKMNCILEWITNIVCRKTQKKNSTFSIGTNSIRAIPSVSESNFPFANCNLQFANCKPWFCQIIFSNIQYE